MTFDLLIRGGTVFDGSGTPGRPLDLAIRDGRLAALGTHDDLAGAVAAATIDATGRYVAPGFIDIHTHSDRTILVNPRMESKLRQGVTTEIGGNCGSGVAPALGEAVPKPRDDAAAPDLEDTTWPTMGAYLAAVEQAGIAGNYGTWTGHGTLRASAVGYAMRRPTGDELAAMARLLRESLNSGAFGLSSGLIYVPSGYADGDELAALAGVVAERGGVYTSHLRNESGGLVEAVVEALDVGRRAGVPVQIAHHKVAGQPHWGLVHETLALMDRARADGVDVACDQYPYVASSTGLSSILPKWALEGGRSALVERLRDGALRRRIGAELLAERPDRASLDAGSYWHSVLFAACRAVLVLFGLVLWFIVL
jgi:N-acyl-D-amino-acid deacylase